MQQGEQFVASGDLVTARLVFQRAAEAGDATAALAMGATYDPTVLAKLGARGIGSGCRQGARAGTRKPRNSARPRRRIASICWPTVEARREVRRCYFCPGGSIRSAACCTIGFGVP